MMITLLPIISLFWNFNISFWVSSVVLAIHRNRSPTIIPFYPSRKLNLVSGVCYTVTIWLGILSAFLIQWGIMGINAFRHLPLNFYIETLKQVFFFWGIFVQCILGGRDHLSPFWPIIKVYICWFGLEKLFSL